MKRSFVAFVSLSDPKCDGNRTRMNGQFVNSLDFEWLSGICDLADRDTYGKNVLGVRYAIPKMLELFAEKIISVTWVTVGFLFHESKEELLVSSPDEQPIYSKPGLSNFSYIDEISNDERSDSYYFAPSLISAIPQTPGQEIGTHTLSHFYYHLDGQTLFVFQADTRTEKATICTF